MANIFYPDIYLDSKYDIDLDSLKEKGIKGLILDIDNTLVPQFTRKITDEAKNWIKDVEERGFSLCILSNAKRPRVDEFTEDLDIFSVHLAKKPLTSGFKRALKEMNLKKEEVAIVGDQIFTDVMGGRIFGIYSILLKPISKDEIKFVKFKRHLEKVVLRRYLRKQGNIY